MKHSTRLIIILSLVISPFVFAQTGETTQTTSVTTTTTTVNNMDADLVSAVNDKLSKDSALIGTSITATSQHGVVTLSGAVTQQDQADEAVIAAKSVPGVKDVKSLINVLTNPTIKAPIKSITGGY